MHYAWRHYGMEILYSALARGIHRWPVNLSRIWTVMQSIDVLDFRMKAVGQRRHHGALLKPLLKSFRIKTAVSGGGGGGHLFKICSNNWFDRPPIKLYFATSGFSSHTTSNADIDVFYYVRLNKLLKKQSSFQWFEIPCRSCDVTLVISLFCDIALT